MTPRLGAAFYSNTYNTGLHVNLKDLLHHRNETTAEIIIMSNLEEVVHSGGKCRFWWVTGNRIRSILNRNERLQNYK